MRLYLPSDMLFCEHKKNVLWKLEAFSILIYSVAAEVNDL